MKLLYKVLWFDDQPDNIENFKKGIARILKDNGFKLDVESRNSISDDEIIKLADDLKQYNPYDLIIFDHDLGISGVGSDIAQKLRRSIFTDMVYYSGKPVQELRNELCAKAIDGVFIVSRDNFVNNIQPIIEDQISKFTDMNNMRGLILDAFSEIDLRLRYRLNDNINAMPPTDQEVVLGKFKNKHLERSASLSKLADNLKTSDLQNQTCDFMNVDFNFIRIRLNKIERDHVIWKDDGVLAEIQKTRNILAHNMYTFDEKNNTVIVAIPNGKIESFNAERFKRIRIQLLDLFEALDQIGCVLHPPTTNCDAK